MLSIAIPHLCVVGIALVCNTMYVSVSKIAERIWQILVILADNVNQFKKRLDKHWKMHDIVFNYRADFAETGGLAWVSC